MILGIFLIQLVATAILLSRLLQAPGRYPPLQPRKSTLDAIGTVSIVVPTLNEAHRIDPCLEGLTRQGYEVREILVVDSNSTDGTQDKVKAMQQRDPRFRLLTDDPLPPDWVGRPWALHSGFLHTSEASEWVLGIDADTQPQPGLVASAIATATALHYDVLSLAPQFVLTYPGELWLQPALLITLVYRFGASGAKNNAPERVMANGQCFLCRRSVLTALGGYSAARGSFCDDVTLARHAASRGFRVGFLDGAKVLKVRMYEGAWETWREWGRSLDLKDASQPAQTWGDVAFLSAVQGLPLPLGLVLAGLWILGDPTLTVELALGLNLFLVVIRFALLLAIAPSYDRPKTKAAWLFWLSPLADSLAVLRIALSAMRSPRQWRGRIYNP